MSRPRVFAAIAGLVTLAGVAMCTRDRLAKPPSPPASTSAEPALYRPDRPPSFAAQGHDALADDARLREARFLEAAHPGRSFATTRLSRDELLADPTGRGFDAGGRLFHHLFTRDEGFAGKDRSALSRVHRGGRGGPDAYTCAACHRIGGPAGAGAMADNAFYAGDGDQPGSALQRNPPSLAGAGLIELVAREMSAELQAGRDRLAAQARREGKAVRGELRAKGVSFGFATVGADGRLDSRELEGVDPDLVVKPFGWKGHVASLRDMVEDQLAIHHGMQSGWLATHGQPAKVGEHPKPDPDGDGVIDEITDAQLDALTLFVAMQETPQVGMPRDSEQVALWATGQRRFREIGCASCHVPSLPLNATRYELPARDGGPPVVVDLATQGADPRVTRDGDDGPYRVYLFSDLKRHVVGPYLREARSYHGVSGAAFMTPRLWGLARSAPFLHDGRAATLDRAIIEHSGEATKAAKAYADLHDEQRAPIRIYLLSLTRARRLVAR